eukprot:1156620-Pelagomonas_calceolata.AAC.9
MSRSTDAQNVEVDEQALQAAVWRATGFDSAMIDALSSSSSSSSTLSEQEMAGAIIGEDGDYCGCGCGCVCACVCACSCAHKKQLTDLYAPTSPTLSSSQKVP